MSAAPAPEQGDDPLSADPVPEQADPLSADPVPDRADPVPAGAGTAEEDAPAALATPAAPTVPTVPVAPATATTPVAPTTATAPGVAGADRPVMVVLRGLGMGALLTAVPALRALRRAHPGHRIVLGVPSALAPLVPMIGGVDEVCDIAGPGHVPPLGRSVDVAVNLYGGGPHGVAALHRTGPARLLTHAHPAFPAVPGPPWRDGVHEVRRWCDLLGWYGVPADPADLALERPARAEGEPRPVVVHPGAAYPARRWPPERFALAAAALREDGHEVVVTGSARERDLAERVALLARLPSSCVLAGRTGPSELAALVARACLVICGDTGVAHLATAFATPSVVIFGPVTPALWGPPETGPHAVLWAGSEGDPYAYRPDPGLLEIGVRDVLSAAERLLEVSVR